MKRKIAVIASSRATYGYKRKILKALNDDKDIILQLIVTGMHLSPEYGRTINEILEDKLPISAKIDMLISGDSPSAYAKSLSVEMQSLVQVLDNLKPDLLLVTGDRGEMFIACVTAAYMGIPVAHIQSGDVSGHIDGSARHAITKLSHIHFPSCSDSAERVQKMGEEKWRIHNVGAPQLDDIIHGPKLEKKEIEKNLGFILDKKFSLVIQHPVLVESDNSYIDMRSTLEAINECNLKSIIIYPNIDSGNKNIIRAIEEFRENKKFFIIENLERKFFIGLLKHASLLIGNSSSGILEAPSFKLPVINIGERQRGRMQAKNIINVKSNKKDIIKAINKSLTDKLFLKDLQNCKNPYGDGKSSSRIIDILKNIKIDKKLLDKIITY